MDKILKLLEIAKKFGVKPSKVIGTQGNIVPMKKPSLVDISVDEFKLKDSVDKGSITMDLVQQEMEETVRLALSKNLNDVELNRAINNAVNLDRVFFPPSAEIIEVGSKQRVTGKGIESLKETAGQTSPPGTIVGDIESRINKLKELGKEMEKTTGEKSTVGNVLKEFGTSQSSMSRIEEEGLVRAAARQILINDIKAGKIKNITASEVINMREPLDPFRKLYGEDALEQLDSLIPEFKGLKTEIEAEKLARTKFKFEPDENRLPGSTSIEDAKKAEQEFGINKPDKPTEVTNITAKVNQNKDLDDLIYEHNKNKETLAQVDDKGDTLITYPEYKKLQSRNREIENILDSLNVKPVEEVKTEGIVIPFRKKFPEPEPEGKAQGGIIGYAMGGRTIMNQEPNIVNEKTNSKTGLDYLMGF